MRKLSIRISSLLLSFVCLVGGFAACGFLSSDKCDHIEGEWVVDEVATLTSTGKRHTECTICGEIINSETIPKEICAHPNTKWIIDVNATLDAEGSKHLECDTCGKTIRNEVIPKEVCAHTNAEWIVDIEATLDAEGRKHLECCSCGNTIETEVIPELYLTQSEVTEKLKSAVVKVICYDYDGKTEISQGSGFFIDSKGTFITNAHVVKDCFFIKIKTCLGVTYDVDVMYEYNAFASDYAICKAKNCYSSNAVEFTTKVAEGDTVYALGYPNDAFIMTTTVGKITSTDVVDGTKHYYASTAFIDHGSSGGILADAKGRVIGITTGIFADGEYAALKYQDFKFDAEGSHIGGKAPLEYFHTVDEVRLASHNMDDYFDIIVNGTATSDTNVTYWVTVQLKDEYKNAKIVVDSVNISVTVKLETEYKYEEIVSYGSVNRTKTDIEYLYFHFWDEGEMITGDRQYTTSSIFLPYSTEYYGMNIAYDADFFGGNGTIIIYDK